MFTNLILTLGVMHSYIIVKFDNWRDIQDYQAQFSDFRREKHVAQKD